MRSKPNQTTPARVNTRSSAKNPPPPPLPRAATPRPAKPLDTQEQLHNDCKKVLDFMATLKLDLGTFIHAIYYGNAASRGDTQMRDARNALYKKNRFSEFLGNVLKPPKAPSGGGTVATTGRDILIEFAMKTVLEIFTDELAKFSRGCHVDKATVADWDSMSRINSDSLAQETQADCPHLWKTLVTLAGDWVPDELELSSAADTDNDPEVDLDGMKVSIRPHPHFGTIVCIALLAFRLNRRNNKLQTLLGVYIHAKKTDKFVHNLCHQSGVTMSYHWSTDFVTHLKDAKKAQAIALAATKPIAFMHNNIRMPFKVRSERNGHMSVTDNGTAISMIVLPESGHAFEDPDDFGLFYRRLQELRIDGRAPRLSWEDLMHLDRLKRVSSGYTFDVLDILLMIPNMKSCKVFHSSELKRPTGPKQLPSGPEHRTRFEMLPTVDIDESTASGNIQVIKFMLDYVQLLRDEGVQNRLALECKIPWTGDQMTAQLCQIAQLYFNECFNPIERLNPFIFYYALFHCEMALAAGTYEHSRGTVTGTSTLARSANLLNRTGLHLNMNKTRLDFHKCDKALLHDLEARMRGAFRVESGCTDDNELIAWVNAHTAAEVLELVTRVYTNHASAAALSKLRQTNSTDQARPSTILTNRDLLRYYSFRHAIKHRDVDRIEDLLPELLIFFSGLGNSNYAKETYNFLQLITHELTPKLREAVLKHGLLVNIQGRSDSFYPIDQRQEHNNAGIQAYAPSGPGSTWTHIQKVSPVIPYYMDNVKHVEEQILGQKRSHIHKDPKREGDVLALMRIHAAGNIHIEVPGRPIDKDDVVKDCVAIGTRVLQEKKLKEYADKREQWFSAISDEVDYNTVAPLSPPPTPPPTSSSLVDLDT
ncbi:hypothetical protein FRC06_005743 [Ceratobasidium sp. 370]|nr:hypothetical protein FRC06_005743 [Ceratobasidium sp. 370]